MLGSDPYLHAIPTRVKILHGFVRSVFLSIHVVDKLIRNTWCYLTTIRGSNLWHCLHATAVKVLLAKMLHFLACCRTEKKVFRDIAFHKIPREFIPPMWLDCCRWINPLWTQSCIDNPDLWFTTSGRMINDLFPAAFSGLLYPVVAAVWPLTNASSSSKVRLPKGLGGKMVECVLFVC